MKSQLTALSVYGLEDLIAGKTPTFSGWTVNPTDAADITDDDVTTFCTTGNKVTGGGLQHAIFEWDLGAFYNIFTTGVGHSSATAGTPNTYVYLYDGTNWIRSIAYVNTSVQRLSSIFGGMCSKVRLTITSTAAATIAPNIREFHVWRLK